MQPKMFENQSKKSHSPKKYKKDERLLPVVALKYRLEKLKGQKMGGCHFVKLTSDEMHLKSKVQHQAFLAL